MLFWFDENLHLWKEMNNCAKWKLLERQTLNLSFFTSHMGYISSDLGRFKKKKPADAFYAFFSVCRIGLSYVYRVWSVKFPGFTGFLCYILKYLHAEKLVRLLQ